jgi:glucose/arabinose dehydrogenase
MQLVSRRRVLPAVRLQQADGDRLLRPVGVAIGPDGALYFTSDSHLEGLFRLRPATAANDVSPDAP